MKAHFPPFDTVDRGCIESRYREKVLQQSAHAVPTGHSGGPLPSLTEQLQRVGILRSRLSALAERVIGPRSCGAAQGEVPTIYGGVLGALEGETATLRQSIDEMLNDIGGIESALS